MALGYGLTFNRGRAEALTSATIIIAYNTLTKQELEIMSILKYSI
jgi:hypothetical protein